MTNDNNYYHSMIASTPVQQTRYIEEFMSMMYRLDIADYSSVIDSVFVSLGFKGPTFEQ